MITAETPYAVGDGFLADGRMGDWHGAGRFADFDVEEDSNDSTFCFSWTLETTASTGYAVFIFLNGTYKERVTGTQYCFTPQAGESRWDFAFLVLPNEGNYSDDSFVQSRNFKDSLRLTYDIDGEVYKVQIYKNTTGETTVDYTGTPLKTFYFPVAALSGTSNASVSGSWPKNIERAADITITMVYAGTTGTAQFQWTWGSLSGSVMTTQTYPQDIGLNGLKLSFADGATWTEGQTFTIQVQFKLTYDTGDLENGYHLFGVVTRNVNGFPTFSDEVAYTLSAVPEAPEIKTDLISYTDGTGSLTLWWQIPNDVGVNKVWVYRNYPADGFNAIEENFVWDEATVSPGDFYNVTVNNLQEGLNQIWARCGNDGEREENLITSRYDLLLDSSLNNVSVPNAPNNFKAEVQEDGSITVTVWADSTGTTLTIYGDGGTGTMDYGTALATISNPGNGSNQKLTYSGLYLADDTYLIGVRHKTATVEETNTTTKTLVVDTALAPKATSLALELID